MFQEEEFEIEEKKFNCPICGKELEFEFEEIEIPDLEEIEEIDPDFKMKNQVEPELEKEIVCDCGAEYKIRKIEGMDAFKVTRIEGTESELEENMNKELGSV